MSERHDDPAWADGVIVTVERTEVVTDAPDAADPAAIRAGIRETRDRLGDTLEEIGERINPRHLREQVADSVRDATIGRVQHMAQRAADRVSETRRTIMDAIRDNPIPAAMVGIGLGWIYLNARRQGTDGGHRPADGWTAWPQNPRVRYAGEPRPYAGSPRGGAPYEGDTGSGVIDRVRERAADAGESVRETVGGLADRAEDAAREAADRAQDVASSVAHEARDRARRVEDHFHENPLAVGAAALALGVAAGLSLPVTDREVALMGDARDRVVDRAREAARETTEKVEAVAARVADEARETARDAARAQGLTG